MSLAPTAPASPSKPYEPITHEPFNFKTHFSSTELAWLETAFGPERPGRKTQFENVCQFLSHCHDFQLRMTLLVARTDFMNQSPTERTWLLTYTYYLVQLVNELTIELAVYRETTKQELSPEWTCIFFEVCIAYWTPSCAYNRHPFKFAGRGEDQSPLWKYNTYLAVHLMKFLLEHFVRIDEDYPIGMTVQYTFCDANLEVTDSGTHTLSEQGRDSFFLASMETCYFVYYIQPSIITDSLTKSERAKARRKIRKLRKSQVWDGVELLNPAYD